MIRDFLDEWGFLLIIVLVLAAITGGMWWLFDSEAKERAAHCARAYAMATTPRDSIAVMGMCELRQRQSTTVVTSPVIIR